MYKLTDQDMLQTEADQDSYKQAKAQDDRIAGWFDAVQDAKAKDGVIAEDMDLGRMDPNDNERFCDQG